MCPMIIIEKYKYEIEHLTIYFSNSQLTKKGESNVLLCSDQVQHFSSPFNSCLFNMPLYNMSTKSQFTIRQTGQQLNIFFPEV